MTSQIIEALMILVGVAALLFLVLRGSLSRRLKGLAPESPIKVVTGLRLGARERVIVLEIKDDWLVVGSSPAGLHTLHTLKKPPTDPSSAAPSDEVFSSWLKKLMSHRVS